MNTRHDTFTQFGHYWIRFYNGTHEVRFCKNHPDTEDPEIRTVFSGHYEQCVDYVREVEIEDLESRF